MNCQIRGRHPARVDKHIRSGERGAGLLEVLIAVVLLAVITLGMVEFFAKGRIWFDQEERKRVATLLAQEALERTVARGYPQIQNWSENRTISSTPYTIQVLVQSDVPEADIKKITSQVTWSATPVAQRSLTLMTLVYDN